MNQDHATSPASVTPNKTPRTFAMLPSKDSNYKLVGSMRYGDLDSKQVVFGNRFGNGLEGTKVFFQTIVREWYVQCYRPTPPQQGSFDCDRQHLAMMFVSQQKDQGYTFFMGEPGQKDYADLYVHMDSDIHQKLVVNSLRTRLRKWSDTFCEVDMLIDSINPSMEKRRMITAALAKQKLPEEIVGNFHVEMVEEKPTQSSGFYGRDPLACAIDVPMGDWKKVMAQQVEIFKTLCSNLMKKNPRRIAHPGPIYAGRSKWLEICPFEKNHPQFTFIIFLILIWSPQTADETLLSIGPKIIRAGLNCPEAFIALSKQQGGVTKIALAMSELGRYGMNTSAVLNLCYGMKQMGINFFENIVQVKLVQSLKWFGPKIVGIVLDTKFGFVHCIPTDVHVHNFGIATGFINPKMTQPETDLELQTIFPQYLWQDINPMAGQIGQMLRSSKKGTLRSAMIFEYNEIPNTNQYSDTIFKRLLEMYELSKQKKSISNEDNCMEIEDGYTLPQDKFDGLISARTFVSNLSSSDRDFLKKAITLYNQVDSKNNDMITAISDDSIHIWQARMLWKKANAQIKDVLKAANTPSTGVQDKIKDCKASVKSTKATHVKSTKVKLRTKTKPTKLKPRTKAKPNTKAKIAPNHSI